MSDETPGDSPAPPAPSAAQVRLLVVDDHPVVRSGIVGMLEGEADLEVVGQACDGREALDVLTALDAAGRAPQVVLMDLRMPVMDGYEASRAIRTSAHPDAARVPIIALSADAYSGDIQKAHDCGMNGHLPKPLDPQMLLEMLQQEIRKAESGN